MKKLIFILTLLTICFRVSAEAWPYTVMAPSGIFLRAEPSKNAKRLLSLPFGSLIFEKEYSDSYYQFSDIDTTIIDGIRGHWMHVKTNSAEGYVFSGYVLAGEWILPSEEGVNKDYQLLRSGAQWAGIVYDPKLNWYVFDQKENSYTLKRVTLTIQTWQTFPEAEQEWYDATEIPFKILVDGRDTVCWLLGSKESFPENANSYSFPCSDPNSKFSFDDGLFLFPEQEISFFSGIIEFQLAAKEVIIIDRAQAEGYRREYRLLYRRIDHNYPHLEGIYEYDLSQDLHLEGTAAQVSDFRTPALQWIGDLNGDKELDFIVFTRPAYESYSGSESYFLFISDKTSGTWIKQVARFSIFYFDNC